MDSSLCEVYHPFCAILTELLSFCDARFDVRVEPIYIYDSLSYDYDYGYGYDYGSYNYDYGSYIK